MDVLDVFICFVAQGAIQGTPRGLSTMLHVAVQLCQISFRRGADADVISTATFLSPSRFLYNQTVTPGPTIWFHVSFPHEIGRAHV